MMSKEEIKEHFANAGWLVDDGFSDYLVIGCSGDTLSIINHREAFKTADGDVLFELLDHMRDVTYWVGEIPNPQQAANLLEECGKPPQEWEAQPSSS